MFVSTVHLGPEATIPAAIAVGAALIWYWIKLGAPHIPASRRRIRRVSLVLILFSLPMFVRALSVIDPDLDPKEYVATWTMALLMVAIVMVIAGVDVMNNLRLLQQQAHLDVEKSARDLLQAIDDRRNESPITQEHKRS